MQSHGYLLEFQSLESGQKAVTREMTWGSNQAADSGNEHFLVVEATKLFKLYWESIVDAISFGIPLVEESKSLADL